MSSVKYHRLLPAATITASLALLAGCVFAVTSSATENDESNSISARAVLSDSSPDAFVSSLHALKAKDSEPKRYEIEVKDHSVSVSVFDSDAEDIEAVREFTKKVAEHGSLLAAARLTEYDPEADVEGYRHNMLLKTREGVSVSDSVRLMNEFNGFNANISFITGNPSLQFNGVAPEAADEVFHMADGISRYIQDETGINEFTVFLNNEDKSISIKRHATRSDFSSEDLKEAVMGMSSETFTRPEWKVSVL